ncbi:unnamed protein product [Cuscuta europaea]|uniref:Uncharacterized protein n=1 Tax=Cuscuta europaea TaxID=41803 RepID=A0A9P0YL60_CUSEU|nr:unnamed protein product [Cuscuta europaea]
MTAGILRNVRARVARSMTEPSGSWCFNFFVREIKGVDIPPIAANKSRNYAKTARSATAWGWNVAKSSHRCTLYSIHNVCGSGTAEKQRWVVGIQLPHQGKRAQ